MHFKSKPVTVAVFAAFAATSFVASAATLRIANQGDALSMDPHSLTESLHVTVLENVV